MEIPYIDKISPQTITYALLIFITVLATLKIKKALKSLKGKQVYKQGYKGENQAEKLLRKKDFKILSTKNNKAATIIINHKAESIHVSPDIIAKKSKEKWLIEVKSGAQANLNKAEVRRQIREYACLYPKHKIGFFDIEKQELFEVEFPELIQKQNANKIRNYSIAFLIGLSCGILFNYINPLFSSLK